jgi:WD40 repeat protein
MSTQPRLGRVPPAGQPRAALPAFAITRRLLALLALAALALPAPPPAPARADAKAGEKEVGKLIEQLGDDEQTVRKAAEKRLYEIGEDVLPQLRKAAKGHPDADVRLRALILVRAIEKKAYVEIRAFKGHAKQVRHVAFSRDGKQLLTGSQDGTARLWDVETGKELRKFTGDSLWVWAAVFAPDGKHALSSGSKDRALRLWELDTGKEVRRYPTGHKYWAYGAAISPDGKYVASGGAGAPPPDSPEKKTSWTIRLFDADAGKEVRKFEGHQGWVWKVLFSPDGKKLLSAGTQDSTARVWDVESGRQLQVLKVEDGFLLGIAWAPDGKKVLTCGRDGTIRLWDAETGKELRQYTGHASHCECVAITPDGTRFLAGGPQALYLFDLESGKILHRYEGLKSVVNAVALSPDGRRAATGSADGSVSLWGLPK